MAGQGAAGRDKSQFPQEKSRKRHGSEAAVFWTAIPNRSGPGTFRLMAQDLHNYKRPI